MAETKIERLVEMFRDLPKWQEKKINNVDPEPLLLIYLLTTAPLSEQALKPIIELLLTTFIMLQIHVFLVSTGNNNNNTRTI